MRLLMAPDFGFAGDDDGCNGVGDDSNGLFLTRSLQGWLSDESGNKKGWALALRRKEN